MPPSDGRYYPAMGKQPSAQLNSRTMPNSDGKLYPSLFKPWSNIITRQNAHTQRWEILPIHGKQAQFAVEEHTAEPCTPVVPSTFIVLRKSPRLLCLEQSPTALVPNAIINRPKRDVATILESIVDDKDYKTLLINSTIQWKRKSNPYFTGPVLFLMMFYVDRVVFRMRVVPRTFPTILGWTSQKLKEREGLERESGGFGRGSMDPQINKELFSNENPSLEDPPGKTSQSQNDVLEEARTAAKELVQKISKWDTVCRGLNSEFPNSNAVKRMQQIAAEVIVAVGKSPRISGTPISETNPKLQFEVINESSSFLAAISRLEMEFFTVKRNLETNSQDLSMPSFSLGLTPEEKENQNEEIQHEEVQHEEIQTKNGDGTAQTCNLTALADDVQSHPQIEPIPAFRESAVQGQQEETVLFQLTPPYTHFTSQEIASGPSPVPVFIKRRLQPQRKKEFARALCSPFWIRNMEALSRLSRAKKVLMDYVFNKSPLLGEVLYKDMFCEMKRSDLISFSEGSVSSLILQIWFRFFNAEEKHRSKSDVYRVSLSTNPFAEFVKISLYDDAHETFCEAADRELVEQQFYSGIDMSTADLVFFLVADETDKDDVYIVCFNMKKEKITIIDSIEDKTKVYDTCVESLKKGMCQYFNEKQLEQKASKISKFPFEITKKACYGNMEGMGVGVIAMRQLETFKGNLNTWKMDLNKNDVNGLRMLCVRYCYEMLTSDHNQLAVQVKRKVAEYGKFIN
ncbi:unnamed protein product [Cuscuta campestris]|uniref:Ubiquitin-like protease family profile domain-containing protein n=1 Tax=Cuscuta campestris TaxID=132261 RepID=A0A484N787_9ASTE|nr:unnamed protein product [Cuscuta campestris]